MTQSQPAATMRAMDDRIQALEGALRDLILAHRGSSHAIDGPIWKALTQAEAILSPTEERKE